MAFNPGGSVSRRNNPFVRGSSPSQTSGNAGRPKSTILASPSPLSGASTPPSHQRSQSNSTLPVLSAANNPRRHSRTDSRNGSLSNTFAPSFIKTEDMRRNHDAVKGIEGENDFSGKRYVWLKDPQTAFVKGWVVEDLAGNRIRVQCDDGSVSQDQSRPWKSV
jgi:myosin heavy chain 9/10/11/14